MDASAGRELGRHARCHILIVNPEQAVSDLAGSVA